MSSIIIQQINLEGLKQTVQSLQRADRSRELSLAITKVEEAIMWLEQAERLSRTITSNIHTQDDIDQNTINFDAPVEKIEEAKLVIKARKEKTVVQQKAAVAELKIEPIIENEPQVIEMKCPAVDDVRMAFKKYVETNGTENGKATLINCGAENISALYAKGDDAVIKFYNLIV